MKTQTRHADAALQESSGPARASVTLLGRRQDKDSAPDSLHRIPVWAATAPEPTRPATSAEIDAALRR